jgi:predicted MFS family arabinose efflux permease
MIWIYSAGMMAFMAMNGILALYLADRFGVTAKTIPYFYLFVGCISVVMRAGALGPLVTRLGEVRVLRLGALSLLLGQVLMPLPSSLAMLALVIPLVPIGTAMLFPATTSQLSRHAPRGRVGETLGLQQAFGGVARMLGPIWAGVAFQHLGVRSPFWLAAVLMAAAGLLTLAVPRAGHPAARVPAVPAAAAPGEPPIGPIGRV